MLSAPTIDEVRRLGQQCSNWGRWGDDDELGTMNLISPEHVARAASTVELGEIISLGLPYDDAGPQTGGFGRFNPIHLMTRDGNDALANTTPRDFYGGRDAYLRSADDIIIMPLQCGTQWDAPRPHHLRGQDLQRLRRRRWCRAAARCEATSCKTADRMAGRGVLLDVRAGRAGVDVLEPGFAIGARPSSTQRAPRLRAWRSAAGTSCWSGPARSAQVRRRRPWQDYAGGARPGPGARARRRGCTRTTSPPSPPTPGGWRSGRTRRPDVFQPMHIDPDRAHGPAGSVRSSTSRQLATGCADIGRSESLIGAPPACRSPEQWVRR